MNPFEQLGLWLNENSMTNDERRAIRTRLVSYATTHPVKSGLVSPYMFRSFSIALASLIIVLGGSIGITKAAEKALPNNGLYPLKIWIEEYKAKSQTSPEDVIAFETKRIETRFDEATRLAVAHGLDDTASNVIQSGIEHSRSRVKSAADSVESHDPELALSATNTLETSFSSNGKILAAIERNTNQSLGTIVMAAQMTTEKLALEKTKFEEIVAMKPDEVTRSAAESKLAMLETSVATIPEDPEPAADEPVADIDPAAAKIAADVTADADPSAAVMMMRMPADMEPEVLDEPVALMATAKIAPKAEEPDPRDLIEEARAKMNSGKYSEALVLLGKAEQLINEWKLTESLEATYDVETSEEGAE